MHATRETYDNDELDWAFDEWVEIEEDHITRNCSAWRVPRPEGFWEVWRGWGDDARRAPVPLASRTVFSRLREMYRMGWPLVAGH